MTLNRLLKPVLVAAFALNVIGAACLVPEDTEEPAANSRPPAALAGCSEPQPPGDAAR